MNSTLLVRITSMGLVVGMGAVAACGGSSDDEALSGGASGSAGTTSGGSAGSGGTSSGGKAGTGGTATAGAGGTTTAGAGGTTTAGAGGTTTAGAGGTTTAGAGGTTMAGAGGTTTAGAGGSAGGSCANPSVDILYDLTGTTFEITNTPFGAGDQVNTVQMPYTDPKNLGPGTIKLRFSAPGGQPDMGRIDVIDYDLVLEFTVSAGGSTVHTDLVVDVTPPVCSGARGAFAGGVATWMDPGLDPYHTKGQVTCMGGTCMLGGLPNGTPQPRDTTEKLKLNPFTFTNGTTDFTMPKVQVSGDTKSKTWLALKGKAVGAPTPSCGCE